MDRTEIKQKILQKTLEKVPSQGWHEALLTQAAQEVMGESSWGWRLFPKGTIEAIDLWHARVTHETTLLLSPIPEGRVRDRVALSVKTRLRVLTPHRNAVRQTVAYLRAPFRIPHALRLLYRTADDIWHHAGDTSTDYNFYTKRALLASLYRTTLIHWLQDTSEGYEHTWQMLDRAIERFGGQRSVVSDR